MARARLRLPLVWLGAQLGMHLAALDDAELARFAIRQQTCWGLLCSTCLFFYLSGSVNVATPEAAATVGWAVATFGLAASVLANLRLRTTLAVAMMDRTSTPAATGGLVGAVIEGRQGGWPLLLRDGDGRWLWLTGRERDLRRVRARLLARRPGVRLEVRVTVTYYPRTHVIKEITGMTVEERETAPALVPRLAPSPAG